MLKSPSILGFYDNTHDDFSYRIVRVFENPEKREITVEKLQYLDSDYYRQIYDTMSIALSKASAKYISLN